MELVPYTSSLLQSHLKFLGLHQGNLTPTKVETAFNPYYSRARLGDMQVEVVSAAEARVSCLMYLFEKSIRADQTNKFTLKLPFPNKCLACRGRGFYYLVESLALDCPICKGTGRAKCDFCFKGNYFIEVPDPDKPGQNRQIQKVCTHCEKGLDKDSRRKCRDCRGTGNVLVPNALQKYAICPSCETVHGSGRSKEKTGNPVLTKELGAQLRKKISDSKK